MTFIPPDAPNGQPEIQPPQVPQPDIDPASTPQEVPPLDPAGGDDGDSRPHD